MTKENVKERLVNFFTKNVGLKLISVVIAVIMWLVVINATDPPGTQTFRNVPVSILNAYIISDSGKTLEILDNSDTVATVVIKAPRSVIQDFGSSVGYISVTADMKNLSDDSTTVPLVATTTKYTDKIESIRLSSNTLSVKIENEKTVKLPVSTTISGDLEEGYVLGDIIQSQNQVRVSGPESIVEQIKTAAVDVEVTGFTDNISTSADIELYDANGEEIDQKNLKLNIAAVKVDVAILATKTVPVIYSATGSPAEGYELTGVIESNINEVTIAGKPSAIDDISEIVVPSEVLNVNGLTATLHSTVNLPKYLPSGVSIVNGINGGKANVSVYIEGYAEYTYSVYLRNIEVLNLPEGFSSFAWSMNEDFVEFTLVGLEQNLEKVQLSQLNYSVDFSDYELMNDFTEYKVGRTYRLPLLMELPAGVNVKENVTVGVKLVK